MNAIKTESMIDEKIKELSDFLLGSSAQNSDFHPVDRFFLQPYIGQITELNRNDFLLYNLELVNTTYSTYLILCLPELWQDITVDDLLSIINRFTNDFSYFTFIYFTYKYVEINSIKLILELCNLKPDTENAIKSYIKNQYRNFLKTETDYFFFDVGAIGVENDDWMYIKQRLLVDSRIESALLDVAELDKYITLYINGSGNVSK
jgi:hypothetical protein